MIRACKYLCAFAFLCAPAFAAQVTVADTLNNADGTPANCTVFVSWQRFTNAAGQVIAAGNKSIPIVAGVLNTTLEANIGATPTGTSYQVQYSCNGTYQPQGPERRSWVIPATGPVNLATIETTLLTGPVFYPVNVNLGGTGGSTPFSWAGNLEFLTAGTGGVGITAQAKLQQFINVQDFGAQCAGNPLTDDYGAIQAAITYAASIGPASNFGATIYFPPGNCYVSHSLDLPENVHAVGQSHIATGIFAQAGGTFSTYIDADTLAITGQTSSSSANPIVLTTPSTSTLINGKTYKVAGVVGNTAANGTFAITVVDSTHFSLPVAATGTWTSGGTIAAVRKYLSSIGGTSAPTVAVPASQWRSINFFGNGVVDTDGYSGVAEENSGYVDVQMSGATKYGIDFITFFSQNSLIRDVVCYANSTAVAFTCIHLYQSNSRNKVSGITSNADAANLTTTQTAAGVLVEQGSAGGIDDVHCEGTAICVQINDSNMSVHNVHENDDTPDTMILLLIKGASTVTAENISKYGGSNQITICDTTKVGTLSCGGFSNVVMMNEINESFYASEWNSSATPTALGNIISSNQYNYSNFHFLATSSLQIQNIAQFTGDTGGGTLLYQIAPNNNGLMLQTSAVPTHSYIYGGLHLQGGGFNGDAASGSACAGAETDNATWVAHATSASCISFLDGMVNFYNDIGLTPKGAGGTPNGVYTPTRQVVIGPSGMTLTPSAFSALPTCTSGLFGTQRAVSDSTTNTWGATITGSGSNKVLAFCDGANWTVEAK